MSEFGICMAGCGPSYRRWLIEATKGKTRFNYMEIGIAYGGTLRGACEIMDGTPGLNWHAWGVDLPDGWSLDKPILKEYTDRFGDRVTIILRPSVDVLLDWHGPELDFLMVDGCHERQCCVDDFEAAIPNIAPGGILAFHDSGHREQGGSTQPHKGEPIGVRAALKQIGFIDGKVDGWEVLEDCIPPAESGCFFVRKL